CIARPTPRWRPARCCGRAYLRVWTVLDHLATDFYDTVDRAVVAELEAERNPPARNDDNYWALDEPPLDVRYLAELRERDKARRDFAAAIDERVAELERADDRHPGREHVLDWTGWAERVEHLQAVIAAGGPATDPGLPWNARQRLATAPAETATLLGELEAARSAGTSADVTSYLAREIWTGAASIIGGPLVTSYASLAQQLRLPAESARRGLVELHRAGRVKLYRYYHGRQSEADPAHLHEQATFHLVLIGDCDDADQTRPMVIVDL
ncbi:hypothetical protein ACWEPC_32275, partial [Nonomuraea sp. NPDC004297]